MGLELANQSPWECSFCLLGRRAAEQSFVFDKGETCGTLSTSFDSVFRTCDFAETEGIRQTQGKSSPGAGTDDRDCTNGSRPKGKGSREGLGVVGPNGFRNLEAWSSIDPGQV